MKSLPIGPEEAFVLSRVDGNASVADIALQTGMGAERVSSALQRLGELGAVQLEGVKPRETSRAPTTGGPPDSQRILQAATGAAADRPSAPSLKVAKYDPAELAEEADLDADKKKRILDTYYLLERLSHYELLGVPDDAEKKAIKKAYYDAVAMFHPDRYFGKNLGNFKPKLERVFAQMTEAQEVLTRKQTRAEYDEYLAAQRRTRRMERQLGDHDSVAMELEDIRRLIQEQAQAAARASRPPPPTGSSPPPARTASRPRAKAVIVEEVDSRGDRRSDPRVDGAPVGVGRPSRVGPRVTPSQPRIRAVTEPSQDRPSQPEIRYAAQPGARHPSQPSPSPSQPSPSPSQPSPSPSQPSPSASRPSPSASRPSPSASQSAPRPSQIPGPISADPNARRKALLRKLGSRSSPPPRRPSSIPAMAAEVKQEAAVDELRRRYEDRLSQAKDAQIKRYLDAADQAQQEGNSLAAANALRIAVSLRPGDLRLAARFEAVQNVANSELAETYLNQARYEERSGHFVDAASSYARAAKGRPDAMLYERAAHCLLEAGEDIRTATEYGRQALALDANSPRVRVTLARIYLAQDMRQSALAELERAAAIAPNDDTIKDWLKRVKRNRV